MCKTLALIGFDHSAQVPELNTRIALSLSGAGVKTAIVRFQDNSDLIDQSALSTGVNPWSEQIPVLRNSLKSLAVVDNLNLFNAPVCNYDESAWRNYLKTELPIIEESNIALLELEEMTGPVVSALAQAHTNIPIIVILSPEQVGNGAVFQISHILRNSGVQGEVSIILNEVHYQELTDLVCARLSFDLGLMDRPNMRLIGCLPSEYDENSEKRFSGLDHLYWEALDELVAKIRRRAGSETPTEGLGPVLNNLRNAMLNPVESSALIPNDEDPQVNEDQYYYLNHFENI